MAAGVNAGNPVDFCLVWVMFYGNVTVIMEKSKD